MKKILSLLIIITILCIAAAPASATDYYGYGSYDVYGGYGVAGVMQPSVGGYDPYQSYYQDPYQSDPYGYANTYQGDPYSYGYQTYGASDYGYSYPSVGYTDPGYATPYTDTTVPQYSESYMFNDYPSVQGAYLENPAAYTVSPEIAPPADIGRTPTAVGVPAPVATRTDIYPGSADYTVTYNPGHYASGTASTTWYSAGTTVTLQGQIYSRPGYIQTGWTEVDGGTKMYNLCSPIFVNRNYVLYPFFEIVSKPLYLTVSISGNGYVRLNGGNVYSGWSGKLEPNQSYTFTFHPAASNYVYSILLGGSYRSIPYGNQYTVTYDMLQGQNQTMYVRFGSVYSSPKTGDDSHIVLWTTLCIASIAGLGTLVLVRKKRKE